MGICSTKPDPLTPLGCLLQNLFKLGLTDMICPERLISLCSKIWPQYGLDNGTRWPPEWSLVLIVFWDLENFCRHKEKWTELTYAYGFWALCSHPSLSSQCLAAPILVAKVTMPPNSQSSENLDFDNSSWTMQPKALAPPPLPQAHTTQPPQVEQHSPHSSPSSPTLFFLNPADGRQPLTSHLHSANLLCL